MNNCLVAVLGESPDDRQFGASLAKMVLGREVKVVEVRLDDTLPEGVDVVIDATGSVGRYQSAYC